MRLRDQVRICYAPDGGNGGGNGGGDPPPNKQGGDPPPNKEGGDPPPPPAWLESLPEAMRGDERLKGIDSVEKLTEGFLNRIELPGKDAKPEDAAKVLDAIAQRLGMPEKADGYTIPDLPDGKKYTDEGLALQAAFKPIAREARMTQDQVNRVLGFYNQHQMSVLEKETTGLANTEADLRKAHGDKFDEKLELGRRATGLVLEKSGLALDAFKFLKLADGSFLGDSKLANILFIGIGEALADTKYVGGGGPQPAGEKASLADNLYTSMQPKKE